MCSRVTTNLECWKRSGIIKVDHGVLIQAQSEVHIDGHRRRPLGSAQVDFLLMIFKGFFNLYDLLYHIL